MIELDEIKVKILIMKIDKKNYFGTIFAINMNIMKFNKIY